MQENFRDGIRFKSKQLYEGSRHSSQHIYLRHSQEWCDVNPVIRIEVPKIKERYIEPLSLKDVEKLKEATTRPDSGICVFP